MPYDPDDLYTAEPKLLSLDCFPVFFTQPVPPPDYDIIMAGNTRYQRISDDMNRVSMESSNPELDAGLLLLDPMATRDDDVAPPKKSYKFSCHPTLFFRLLAVCVFIPAFVLLILAHRPRNLSSIIFVAFSMTRNILILLHHICSSLLRIKFSIELRGRGPIVRKPTRSCPDWLKQGILHVLLDLILFTVTLITTIIANSGAYAWRWYYNNDLVVPGCVLSYIGW